MSEKRFVIYVEEIRKVNNKITVVAKDKAEALQKAKDWDYEEIDEDDRAADVSYNWDGAEVEELDC